MNIMIGEDNISMRKSIRRFLENNIKGITEIYECANGEEAITLYNEYRPSWTLLDIEMNPIDGLTAAKIIKSVYPGARIILVSNYDDEEYIVQAKKIDASAYVLKDSLNDLVPLLKELPEEI